MFRKKCKENECLGLKKQLSFSFSEKFPSINYDIVICWVYVRKCEIVKCK